MTEESLFELLLNTTHDAREGVLNRECAGDPELRRRVEALLAAHADPLFALPHGPDADATRNHDGHTASYHDPAGTQGSVIAGRYKLLQQIGEGGMGTVWMADQTEPVKRRVAVKLIRAERGSSKTILTRFEAERQAIALMDHPNIAKLLDAGTTDAGSPYFVMELVKGVPLTDYCDAHRLRVPERLNLFTQICSAVQHAHQKGVIHRDLKPTNILVESHDGKPVPKVIDFGLAKATTGLQLTEHTLFTGFGSVMGTPLYMSPEQAAFNAVDVDTRADVYSLGVILYELLTGTTPLTRETVRTAALDVMLKMIREQDAPTPSSRLSGHETRAVVAANRQTEPAKLGRLVRGELDWIVLKALSKERDRRYETASGFAKDVERFMNHEPVQAGPPTVRYRLRKLVRRNRPQVIAAGLIVSALVAGIVGTSLGLIRSDQALRRAVHAEGETSAAFGKLKDEEENTRAARDAAVGNAAKATRAEKAALRQAASSGCDAAQQLCEGGSVYQGVHEFNRALGFAHKAGDAELEDAIRFNLGMWSKELHALAFTVTGKDFVGSRAAFHPGGKTFAVVSKKTWGSLDDPLVVRLFDAFTGAALEPSYTIVDDREVVGWNVATALAWSRDGKILAMRTDLGFVHLWWPGGERPGVRFRVDAHGGTPDRNQSTDIAFSPDGSRLVATGTDSALPIFDTTSGRPTGVRLVHKKGEWSFAVAWSADGKTILTHTRGVAHLWDPTTGRLVADHKLGVGGSVQALDISADSKTFVAAFGWGNPHLQVWELATGRAVSPPMRHFNNVYWARFDPSGKYVLSGDGGSEARLWDAATGRRVGAPIWTGSLTAHVGFRPDGRAAYTSSDLGTVRVWDLAPGQRRWTTPSEDALGAIAFGPDGAAVFVIAGAINRYDRATGRMEKLEYKPPTYLYPGMPLVGAADGETLIIGTPVGRIEWWNTRTRTRTFAHALADEPVASLALSPDGKVLVAGGNSRSKPGAILDAVAGNKLADLDHGARIVRICWSPDGREFVTTNTTPEMRVRDARTGRSKLVIPIRGEALAFHPSGRFVMADQGDYQVGFFDPATGGRLGPVLPHPSKPAFGAFSRDGTLALTADATGTTRLWHLPTGKRVGPLLPVSRPTVSPDGRAFAAVSRGDLTLYDMPERRGGTIEDVAAWVKGLTGQSAVPHENGELPPLGPAGRP